MKNGNLIKKQSEIGEKLADIDNNKIYVTKLIHCGASENFSWYCTGNYDAYRAQYILSSGKQQTSYGTYNARYWDKYIDKNQADLIEGVHSITYDEAFEIIGNQWATSGDKVRYTGATYWLEPNGDWQYQYVEKNGQILNQATSRCFGIRLVVNLKSGVYIVGGEGTEASPYVLAK